MPLDAAEMLMLRQLMLTAISVTRFIRRLMFTPRRSFFHVDYAICLMLMSSRAFMPRMPRRCCASARAALPRLMRYAMML